MELLKSLGSLFGFKTSGLGGRYYNVLEAQQQALKAIEQYSVYPEVSGNPAMLLYRKMLKEDSHLAGLVRRIRLSLLSARVRITCADPALEALIHQHLGFDPDRPTLAFRRLLNELSSCLIYGFSLHEKTFVNDKETGQTRLRLRRIEPIHVFEFTVSGDRLLTVSERYQEPLHGKKGANVRPLDQAKGPHVEVVDLPADRLVHLAPLQEGHNFWGESILEACIADWVLKRLFRYANSILQARFAVPIPVGKTDSPLVENRETIAGTLKMPALEMNRILVMDTDSSLELVSPTTTTDILSSIRYHDFSMSKALLQQFVDIGDKKFGGQAMSEDQNQDFHASLNFFELGIASALSSLASQIAEANGSATAPIEVTFDDLAFRGQRTVLTLYRELVQAGVLEPTADQQEQVLRMLNFLTPPEASNQPSNESDGDGTGTP